ncbi:MAG: hypothetical protein ACYTXA_24330 [Nostoc sp.]
MTLRELEDQALRLSAEDRWQLINTLVRSLQPKLQATSKAKGLAASFRLKTRSLESDHISSCFHESPIGKLVF